MANVFVTQYFERGDFLAAEEWGTVTFMTKAEHRPEPVHPDFNNDVMAELTRALADYIPGTDYILVAPSQVINLAVGSMLRKDCTHRILKWDNRSKTYRLHIMTT